MMLITPPMASEPYNAPCGPRSTSTWAMSPARSLEMSAAPLGVEGSASSIPSHSTLVWLALVPRRKIELWPPAPPAWVTDRPGTSRSTSVSERSWRASISGAVITVTLLASWLSGVGIRVALTTTVSPRPCAHAGAANAIRAAEERKRRFIKRLLAREARAIKIRVSSPRGSTPSGFAATAGYLPLRPAHPGRPQDDGARQVSWLAGAGPAPGGPGRGGGGGGGAGGAPAAGAGAAAAGGAAGPT